MSNIIIRPDWHIPESQVTPEGVYRDRRRFLKEAGFLGAAALLSQACSTKEDGPVAKKELQAEVTYAGKRVTNEEFTTKYNNFYEFTTSKKKVVDLVGGFQIDPWSIEIGGLCENPRTVDVSDLIGEYGEEERIYHFRCVEAWGMIVPWNGFPLSKIIESAKPKSDAKYVRFVTANKPEEMPGIPQRPSYPWPYTEGLTLEEGMHDLSFMATGMYGKPIPKQNGAPIRLVVPWKYGYKSIKSVVAIEFTAKQPATLWNTLSSREYPFESNVEPHIPHPRWSQAHHRMLGTKVRVKTQPYNGYAEQVGHLYSSSQGA